MNYPTYPLPHSAAYVFALAECNKIDGYHELPVEQKDSIYNSIYEEIVKRTMSGMTMREWYAGMALQGYLAGRNFHGNPPSQYEVDAVREQCFKYAEAMMKGGAE